MEKDQTVKVIRGAGPVEQERIGQTGTIIATDKRADKTIYIVQFPDSDTAPFYEWELELVNTPEHKHSYRIASGDLTIRYCVTCGTAWVLENFKVWHWIAITEDSEQ